jgi:hypothetical protein
MKGPRAWSWVAFVLTAAGSIVAFVTLLGTGLRADEGSQTAIVLVVPAILAALPLLAKAVWVRAAAFLLLAVWIGLTALSMWPVYVPGWIAAGLAVARAGH